MPLTFPADSFLPVWNVSPPEQLTAVENNKRHGDRQAFLIEARKLSFQNATLALERHCGNLQAKKVQAWEDWNFAKDKKEQMHAELEKLRQSTARQAKQRQCGHIIRPHEIQMQRNGRRERLSKILSNAKTHKLIGKQDCNALLIANADNELIMFLLQSLMKKVEGIENKLYTMLSRQGVLWTEESDPTDNVSSSRLGLAWTPKDLDPEIDTTHPKAVSPPSPHSHMNPNMSQKASLLHEVAARHPIECTGAFASGPYREDSLLAALSCTKRDIRRNSSIRNGSTRVIKDNYLHTLAGLDEGLRIHGALTDKRGLPGEYVWALEDLDYTYNTPLFKAVQQSAASACLSLLMHGANSECCLTLPHAPSRSAYGIASETQDVSVLTILCTHASILAREAVGSNGATFPTAGTAVAAVAAAAAAEGGRKSGWGADEEGILLQVQEAGKRLEMCASSRALQRKRELEYLVEQLAGLSRLPLLMKSGKFGCRKLLSSLLLETKEILATAKVAREDNDNGKSVVVRGGTSIGSDIIVTTLDSASLFFVEINNFCTPSTAKAVVFEGEKEGGGKGKHK